jgi:hypothetical protein
MWEGCRWCLQQISILVSSYSFHDQLVLIFELRAFVTRGQLTWALFAQYVSQFSASITKHALLAGTQFLSAIFVISLWKSSHFKNSSSQDKLFAPT